MIDQQTGTLSDFISGAEAFLVSHQLLFSYIILPATMAVVSWFTSRAAVRSSIAAAIKQRNFDAHLKLSDFHKSQIDRLKDDAAHVMAISNRLALDRFSSSELQMEEFKKMIFHVSRFKMSFDPDDQAYDGLKEAWTDLTDELLQSIETENYGIRSETIERLAELCRQAQEIEFDRMKRALLESGTTP